VAGDRARAPKEEDVVITATALQDIVGHRFPGGSVRVEPYRNWLTCDAVHSPVPPDGIAHPMFCYYGALAGMGISLDELFALAGATAEDGVMFGEAEIELRRPLRVGERLVVRGGIVGAERKQGQRAGVFDIVTFRLELVDESGQVAGVSTNSFVFPRRVS
jgi:acyl dehydratase